MLNGSVEASSGTREDPYDGDFVATAEGSEVARRHIVEVLEVERERAPDKIVALGP